MGYTTSAQHFHRDQGGIYSFTTLKEVIEAGEYGGHYIRSYTEDNFRYVELGLHLGGFFCSIKPEGLSRITSHTEERKVQISGLGIAPYMKRTFRFLRSERATVLGIRAIMEEDGEEVTNQGLVVECDDGFLLPTFEDFPQRLYSRVRYEFRINQDGEVHFSPFNK